MAGPGPVGAALRSALVPGWGQWATGHRIQAMGLALVSLLLLLLPVLAFSLILGPLVFLLETPGAARGVVAWFVAPVIATASALLQPLLRPMVSTWSTLRLTILGVNGALALVRVWSVVAAIRSTRVASGTSSTLARRVATSAAARFPFSAPSGGSRNIPGWGPTSAAARLPFSAPEGGRRVRSRGMNGLFWETEQAVPPVGSKVIAWVIIPLLLVGPHVALLIATSLAWFSLAPVLVPQTRASHAAAGATAAAGAIAATGGMLHGAGQPTAVPPVWDGQSRLNVLLLGSDRRPDEAAAGAWGNSDTILLLSLDPGLHGAALISVPRDIWLDIPTVGPEKINAAYREGGPRLAVQVVGELLGQPIHRWAAVDVPAFERIIDLLGGVVVDIERPIRDDEYPTMDYGTRRIFLPAGLQWLDGERALWYARSRHQSNDFDRARRQQQLLLALKKRLQTPQLAQRLPMLAAILAEAVQTDVTPRELAAVLQLVASRRGQEAAIRTLVLAPPDFGTEIIRPDLYAIRPNVARIRAAVAQLLGESG